MAISETVLDTDKVPLKHFARSITASNIQTDVELVSILRHTYVVWLKSNTAFHTDRLTRFRIHVVEISPCFACSTTLTSFD